MSDRITIAGTWIVAILCVLTGVVSVVYGYLAISSLSGFSSIFIGVIIIVISAGLTKKHSVARVGAIIILLICSIGCVMGLFFYRNSLNINLDNIGLIEYFCLIYLIASILSIIFLLRKKTKEYFVQ